MGFRAVLAFALALCLLGIFVFAVGWEETLQAVARTDPRMYLGAFLLTLGCLACRTEVWHRILSIVDKPRPYWLVGGVFLTAMFTKYVIPYGQVTSSVGIAALINRYYDSAYEEALAGVVSADFLNYIPYYTFGGIGALAVISSVSPPIAEFRTYIIPAAALIAFVALLIGFLWRRRSLVLRAVLTVTSSVQRLLDRILGREVSVLDPDRVKRRFEGFYTTLDLVTRNRRAVLFALGYAHLGWLGYAGALFVTALAIGSPISPGLALFGVAVSKFGFVVPTPGGVGGVEFALATVLVILTPMGFATATAIAILWRLSTYWFTICIGGLTAVAVTLTDPLPPADE